MEGATGLIPTIPSDWPHPAGGTAHGGFAGQERCGGRGKRLVNRIPPEMAALTRAGVHREVLGLALSG